MAKGKVYFVGAGPSNVELITRNGYKLICQADVIKVYCLGQPTLNEANEHNIPSELLP